MPYASSVWFHVLAGLAKVHARSRRPRPIYMGGGTQSRRIVHAWGVIAVAVVLAGCTSASTLRPAPTATASPSPSSSASPASSASDSPAPGPAATPSPSGPPVLPRRAAERLGGPRLRLACRSHRD